MGGRPRDRYPQADTGDGGAGLPGRPLPLADFYLKLLGWEIVRTDHDFVLIGPSEGGPRLSFQSEAGYRARVWPEEEGEQQKMLHLDLRVEDLESAHAHAIAVGATLAKHQPGDDFRVFLDPAGHPFCLFVRGTVGRDSLPPATTQGP